MEKFIIHNRERVDRYRTFSKELEEQGCIDYYLLPATMDRMNPVKGISESHRRIVKMAKDNNYPSVMIMEDDIKFVAPGALEHFLNLVKNLPEDWDLFLAGMSTGVPEVIDNDISKVGKFTGLHCYIIRAKFYDKFLSATINVNIDAWVSKPEMGNAITYCAIPMLAITYSGYSDNSRKDLDVGEYFNKYKHWKHEDPEHK